MMTIEKEGFPAADYDSRQADFILREAVSNLKGMIDLLVYGGLDDSGDDEKRSFLAKVKGLTENLYELLNSNIVEKANRIQELNTTIRKDLMLASRIQKNMMTADFSAIRGFDIAVKYLPVSEVGGDFFDICQLANGIVRVFMADAIGHGIPAAMVTMLIKSEYEKIKYYSEGPSDVLNRLNRIYTKTYRSTGVFFTAFSADVDLVSGRLRCSSAGHPAQIVIGDDGPFYIELVGKIVGFLETTEYLEQALPLGDRPGLLFFTDGLFEEFNIQREEYGEERLLRTVGSHIGETPAGLVKSVMGDLSDFMSGSPQNDDITIMALTAR